MSEIQSVSEIENVSDIQSVSISVRLKSENIDFENSENIGNHQNVRSFETLQIPITFKMDKIPKTETI